ncbi:MAG TPA: hypothetical protein VM432_05910 [Bdellovibrionales bacterium]|nr:hypothetical protein [Bdellovibrionales bacterium]
MDEAEEKRKLRRVILVIGGVLALLTIAGLVIIFYELPRPFEIRGRMLNRPVLATNDGDVPLAGPPSIRTSGSPRQPPPAAASPSPGTVSVPPSIETPDEVIADYFVERFVDSGATDVRVCENLGDEGVYAPRSRNELHNVMLAQASGRAPENAFVESAIAPLGAILQTDGVSGVIDDIWQARESGAGIVDSAQFYTDAALATADLYSQLSGIERISQHAYHLYVLSRISAGLPGFADQPEVQDLCEAIQDRIEAGIDAEIDPDDIADENAQILALIAEAGLSTGQVGYNPFLPQTVTLDTTVNRFAISAPWMFQQFGGGVSLSGR